MVNRFLFIIVLITCQTILAQKNVFFNDQETSRLMKENLVNVFNSKKFVPYENLQAQLGTQTKTKINISKENKSFSSKNELYEEGKKSTLILGKLFDTERSGTDLVYTATATVVTSDGLCVTNRHVFDSMGVGVTEKLVGVMDFEGTFYKVEEVLGSRPNDDLVLFRIDTKGKILYPLNLGELPKIGDNIHVIGHPKSMYYFYSTGVVSRLYYYAAEQSDRISITADFAVGSSGGPILNDSGQLVGMVAATESIPDARSPQMIIKEIIPISSIKKLINEINTN